MGILTEKIKSGAKTRVQIFVVKRDDNCYHDMMTIRVDNETYGPIPYTQELESRQLAAIAANVDPMELLDGLIDEWALTQGDEKKAN